MRRVKIELLSDLVLLLFYDFAVEFDQLTAGSTDEVIVMLVM